jgi:methionine aminopeptidase
MINNLIYKMSDKPILADDKSDNGFDLNLLNKLASGHKELMTWVQTKLENREFKSNKNLYDFMTNYYVENNLNKAFPIGISVNNIIAHDSYHPEHIIIFKIGDYIKVDFGIEENGHIIDSARTFEYGICTKSQSILDCKEIVESIEKYIKKELELNKKILIQKISIFTNIQIISKGYNSLDFLGGHNIEKGSVHGKKLILNKPLNQLPKECAKYIDINAELSEGEMFAIEVYIPNIKSVGTMVQNVKLPVTHFEIDKDFKINLLNVKERIIFQELKEKTKSLPYEHHINNLFDKKIMKTLFNKQAIIKHLPLEWIDKFNTIKYVQYEDCYIIKDNNLINLTKS